MKKLEEFTGCENKKMSRKEVSMFKKYLSLMLVLSLLIPSMAEAKSMFEENFEREQKELKSEGRAAAISLAATVTPIVLGVTLSSGDTEEVGLCLALGGLVAGPSMGHFYAEQTGRGLKSLGIRAAIMAGGTYLVSSASEELHPDSRGFSAGVGIIAVSAVTLLYGIYDTFTAPSSVRKYNESLINEAHLSLVPEVDPLNKNYGLSLVYNF